MEELGGCIIERELNDRDYRADDILGATESVIPEEYTIDIIDAKDQGALEATRYACTCFGTYHAAETSREKLDGLLLNPDPVKGWELQKKYGTFFPTGDYLRTALKSVVENGVIGDKKVTVTGYAMVAFAPDEKEIEAMKQRLLQNYALITSFDFYENTSVSIKKEGVLPKPKGKNKGGHVTCLIGYTRQGFVGLDSYGPKKGKFKNGTFIVPYENAKYLFGVYLLYTNPLNMLYNDISVDSPNYEDIKFMKDTGLMTGTLEGRFEPDRPLTRRELAIVLKRYHDKFR